MNSMTGFRGAAGGFPTSPTSGAEKSRGDSLSGGLEGFKPTRRALKGDYVPSGYREGQIQQFDPNQMELYKQLFSFLGPDSFLSRLAGGEEGIFDEMEEPAWKQFAQAQGQLGSRYSQMAPGAMSAQRGSGFQNQMGQLGSDFAMNLASRRKELQMQALKDMMTMSNSLLGQRPTEKFVTGKRQKPPTFLEQAGMSLIGQAGEFAQAAAGSGGSGAGMGAGGGSGGAAALP